MDTIRMGDTPYLADIIDSFDRHDTITMCKGTALGMTTYIPSQNCGPFPYEPLRRRLMAALLLEHWGPL